MDNLSIYHFQVVSYGFRNQPLFTVAWQNVKSRLSVARTESMWTICPHWFLLPQRVDKRPFRLMCSFWTHEASGCQLPFSLHGFPAPFRRRFPARACEVIAGYPMQTVMRFSRCGAGFGNKKSPHNNLNLTIPSGMALVRVRYVAIRKLKTCSGSFGSRAGTRSKYVIL